MDAKKILTNKSFCPLPWTGFELEPNGNVKNCIISNSTLGNIKDNDIETIMQDKTNTDLKLEMLRDSKPSNCSGCHLQESHRKDLSSISSRLYYMKELLKSTDISLYNNVKNFSLQHVDLRWTNHCNQACVYCGPDYSSTWAKEIGVLVKSDSDARSKVKKFVFVNAPQLKNIYLAGGEPLLMNENKELLEILLDKNPTVNIRVNTNLSSTGTGVYQLLCKFKNVHWTVSVDTMTKEYEYIRYRGNWNDFVKNLEHIRTLDHKISFNMLFFIFNYDSIYHTVDVLKYMGFHENSFIIGPLYGPRVLNVLNLPDKILDNVRNKLSHEIKHSGHYLKNSFENILKYINETAWQKDINGFKQFMKKLDQRRNLSSQITFEKVYRDIDDV